MDYSVFSHFQPKVKFQIIFWIKRPSVLSGERKNQKWVKEQKVSRIKDDLNHKYDDIKEMCEPLVTTEDVTVSPLQDEEGSRGGDL